ncbi:hypothetical protein COOONC_08280 [Cooperia oncophora]
MLQVNGMIAASFLMSSLDLHADDRDKDVLSIGVLGGFFETGLHNVKPHVDITAVERDLTVLEAANKWFALKPSKNLHLLAQNSSNLWKMLQEEVFLINSGRKFERYWQFNDCRKGFLPGRTVSNSGGCEIDQERSGTYRYTGALRGSHNRCRQIQVESGVRGYVLLYVGLC